MKNKNLNIRKYSLYVLTTLLLASFSSVTYGQYYPRKEVKLGLMASPIYGWLKTENADYDSKAGWGYSYGLLADIGFAENYFLNTGLHITTLQSSLINTSNQSRREYRVQYAEIPLAFKLKTSDLWTNRFYGLFGLMGGVKLSGKEKLAETNSYESTKGIDLFKLGLITGMGMEWRVQERHMLVTGLTFHNGITKPISNAGAKSSYLALNIGFIF